MRRTQHVVRPNTLAMLTEVACRKSRSVCRKNERRASFFVLFLLLLLFYYYFYGGRLFDSFFGGRGGGVKGEKTQPRWPLPWRPLRTRFHAGSTGCPHRGPSPCGSDSPRGSCLETWNPQKSIQKSQWETREPKVVGGDNQADPRALWRRGLGFGGGSPSPSKEK